MEEKIRALVEITEESAIRAGLKTFGKQIVAVDPATLSKEQREEFLTCFKESYYDHEYKIRNPHLIQLGNGCCTCTEIIGTNLITIDDETVRYLMDLRIFAREQYAEKLLIKAKKEAEETEQRIIELIATPVEKIIANIGYGNDPFEIRIRYFHGLPADDPRVMKKRAEIMEIVDAKNKEHHAKRAEKEAEKVKAAERRQAQLDDWVNNYGTDNQKARHALNLLPENEILDALRNKAFECLDSCERFEHLADDDVCICEYDDGQSHVEYESMQSEEATDYQFDKMSEIMALIPKTTDVYTAQMIDYIGECSMCGNKVVRKSVRIEVVVGELTFSREYAV